MREIIDTEAEFRKDLAELLRKHDAALVLVDVGISHYAEYEIEVQFGDHKKKDFFLPTYTDGDM